MATKNSSKKSESAGGFLSRLPDAFHLFARNASIVLGSAWSFSVALLVIVVWGLTGHTFHYSDTWQLIINTGTTIVTFLMVFLIQNTQNRDSKAMQLKLDELIRALSGARNHLVNLDKLNDDELSKIEKEFEGISQRASNTSDSRSKAKSKN